MARQPSWFRRRFLSDILGHSVELPEDPEPLEPMPRLSPPTVPETGFDWEPEDQTEPSSMMRTESWADQPYAVKPEEPVRPPAPPIEKPEPEPLPAETQEEVGAETEGDRWGRLYPPQPGPAPVETSADFPKPPIHARRALRMAVEVYQGSDKTEQDFGDFSLRVNPILKQYEDDLSPLAGEKTQYGEDSLLAFRNAHEEREKKRADAYAPVATKMLQGIVELTAEEEHRVVENYAARAYDRFPASFKQMIGESASAEDWMDAMREVYTMKADWILRGVPGLAGAAGPDETEAQYKVLQSYLVGEEPTTPQDIAAFVSVMPKFIARVNGDTWDSMKTDIVLAGVDAVVQFGLLYATGGASGIVWLKRILSAPGALAAKAILGTAPKVKEALAAGKTITEASKLAPFLTRFGAGLTKTTATLAAFHEAEAVLPNVARPWISATMPHMSILQGAKELAGAFKEGESDPGRLLAHAGSGIARGWMTDKASEYGLMPETPIGFGQELLKSAGVDADGPLGYVADLIVDIAVLHHMGKIGPGPGAKDVDISLKINAGISRLKARAPEAIDAFKALVGRIGREATASFIKGRGGLRTGAVRIPGDKGELPPEKPPPPPPPAAEVLAPTPPPAAEKPPPVKPTAAPEPLPEGVRGVTKEIMEGERVRLGLKPAMPEIAHELKEAHYEALRNQQENPRAQEELVETLRKVPKALTDTEVAMMLHRKVSLENEYVKQSREVTDAKNRGDNEASLLAQAKADNAFSSLQETFDLVHKGGSATGRGLNALKMLMHMDFSYAGMVVSKRGRLGRELTPEEHAEIKTLSETIKSLEKQLEERKTTTEAGDREKALQDKLDELTRKAGEEQKPTHHPKILERAEQIVQNLELRADKAFFRLRKKLASVHALVDPTVVVDLAEIAMAKMARGAVDFAKWSASIINDLGDDGRKAEPFLKEAWNIAEKRIKDGKTPSEKVIRDKIVKARTDRGSKEAILETLRKKGESKDSDESQRNTIEKLALHFVREGVTTRDALVTAVHDAIRDVAPGMSRRDVMDAISGYGKYRAFTKDEVRAKLRDLKGQLQQVAKLEDLARGVAPKKTGVERRTPSDEERRLIKELNEMKRRHPEIVQDDPAIQLKSALDTMKTRLNNQIADLSHQIEKREMIVRKKTSVTPDAEAEALKLKRDGLKKRFNEIFGSEGLTDTQRAAIARKLARSAAREEVSEERAGEREQARKERTLKVLAGEEIRRRKTEERKRLSDASKDAKASIKERLRAQKLLEKWDAQEQARLASEKESHEREERKESESKRRKEWKTFKEEFSENMKELFLLANPRATPEERAVQAMKTRIQNKIESYKSRLAKGDFAKKPRKEIPLDMEAIEMMYKLEQSKREYLDGIFKDGLARRTKWERTRDNIGEVLGLHRAILTSFDSPIFRQGGFIGFGHPIRILRAFTSMIRSMKSPEAEFAEQERIRRRDNYPLYKRYGLYIAELGSSLSKMEEAFMSLWAEMIPGVAASGRVHRTFLNRLRADSFDAMMATMGVRGEVTRAQAEAIAHFINAATGRGSLGNAEGAAVVLNRVFFAPRHVVGRFQIALGIPIWTAPKGARGLIAAEYARSLAGMGVFYGLAALAGFDIEVDPRSSDFGKVRIGRTRIDPLGGLAQVYTLMARMSGKTLTTPERGRKLQSIFQSPVGLVADFLEKKVAPFPGFVSSVVKRREMGGQKITLGKAIESGLTPISFDDIMDAMKEHGVPKGVALGLLTVLGMGVNVHLKKMNRPRTAWLEQLWRAVKPKSAKPNETPVEPEVEEPGPKEPIGPVESIMGFPESKRIKRQNFMDLIRGEKER